jgi:hypothetical protein
MGWKFESVADFYRYGLHHPTNQGVPAQEDGSEPSPEELAAYDRGQADGLPEWERHMEECIARGNQS